MPRVSAQQQFIRYQQLKRLYVERPESFSLLSPTAQLELYGYFQPHEKHSLETLHARHVLLSELEPSVPNRAGKLYKQLMLLLEKQPTSGSPRAERAEADPRLETQHHGPRSDAPDT